MFFHGTTLENANALFNGQCKTNFIWNCSNDDYLYLWSKDEIKKEFEFDEKEEINNMCLQMAFESAQITAACDQTPQDTLVVLEFDFPNADVYNDLSCDNMEMARRVDTSELDGTDLENSLVNIYIAKHNSRLDAFYICGLEKNPLFNWGNIDPDLAIAAEIINSNELYLDLTEFDWHEISRKEFEKLIDKA